MSTVFVGVSIIDRKEKAEVMVMMSQSRCFSMRYHISSNLSGLGSGLPLLNELL